MAGSSTQANYDNETSGSNISVWIDTAQAREFAPLQENIEVDTVIIGAGIAGITTAYCLTQAGKKVAVIEDGLPCSGETGRTTAHIVNALDDFYSELEKIHGKDNAKLAAESHTAAIDFVERTVEKEGIECEFTRLSGYLFLHPSDKIKTLQDEHAASNKAGIKTELVDKVPGISYEQGPALMFPDQAQFHPLKYLFALLERIVEKGGKVFTHTHAEEIKEGLVIANGFSIKANNIVVATNTPINNLFTIHTKQHAYRTYVIAALVPKGKVEKALWWDTGDHDSKWVSIPYTYVRTQAYDDTHDLLIAGGQDHKTGQADAEDISQDERYKNLEDWARLRFPIMTEVVYKWSGQVIEPVDSLAFIGRNPGDNNIYIITGDSGNGMTHGTIGGMLVSDLIMGINNPWRKLYDPARISIKATGDFLKEAGNMAAQYADYLKAGDIKSVKDLAPNEGAILNVGLHKVAAYRSTSGTLNAYTAICPHLGCVLQWNADETSFDCPCHGSRFTNEGVVINGPALSDLKRYEIKEE
ncbi:MAG: FAD-dependent oxidoreductase [Chitinophagaceae bacterium]|nr:FAD-dependent oxidoreductase [Chitinophagaceae bacterium]